MRIAYVEVYDCMTTELFEDEQGQAVRLPEACRFKGEEVVIGKVDELVVLAPKAVANGRAFWKLLQCFRMERFSTEKGDSLKSWKDKQRTTAKDLFPRRTGAVLFVVLSCE